MQTTATLPKLPDFDGCLISHCLKSLFKSQKKTGNEPVLSVKHHISELKSELEQLNEKGVMEFSFSYLLAMEASLPGVEFRYLMITQQGRPVLFASFQLYNLYSRNFKLEKNKGFIRKIIRFFLDLHRVKIMMSGNALRSETLCACVDEQFVSQAEAVEIIISAAEKIAADEKACALILRDLGLTPQNRHWLERNGYQKPWVDQVMELEPDTNWQSIADYLESLTRKYKTRAKKILDAKKSLTLEPMTLEEVKRNKYVMAGLFRQVADRQAFCLVHPDEDHFCKLKEVYLEGFEIYGLYDNQQLIAFYSAFVHTGSYEMYYVGFDYQRNNEFSLYFNLLFAGLDRAIKLKRKYLKLGRTSFDAKASLGARPAELDYFIKTGNIPGIVLKWFTNYFSSMEDGKWKLRNPLKAGQDAAVNQ